MTRKELDDALKLARKTPDGPWTTANNSDGKRLLVEPRICEVDNDDVDADEADAIARFLAASRTLIPALVAECLRWRKRWAEERVWNHEHLGGEAGEKLEEAHSILAEPEVGP